MSRLMRKDPQTLVEESRLKEKQVAVASFGAGANRLDFSNTPKTYLSGSVALNTRSPDGTLGDWHQFVSFRPGREQRLRDFCAGSELINDTSEYFGLDGVHEYSDSLRKEGLEPSGPVYVASHFRALVDLVITFFNKGIVPAPVPFAAHVGNQRYQRMFLKFLNARAKDFSPDLRRAFAQWIYEDRRCERLRMGV